MTEVSGQFETGRQYHFHMETQSCIVRPIENGEFDVFSTTQNMNSVQFAVSKALAVPKNKINLSVRNFRSLYLSFASLRILFIGSKARRWVRRQDQPAKHRRDRVCGGRAKAPQAGADRHGPGDQHGDVGQEESLPLQVLGTQNYSFNLQDLGTKTHNYLT